jgi:hypothetical protein
MGAPKNDTTELVPVVVTAVKYVGKIAEAMVN